MNSAEKILGRCLDTKSIKFDKITKNNSSYPGGKIRNKNGVEVMADGRPLVDKSRYYASYCQCPCKACSEGKKHCKGAICMGD